MCPRAVFPVYKGSGPCVTRVLNMYKGSVLCVHGLCSLCARAVFCVHGLWPLCARAVTALINGCPSDEVQLSSGADQLTGAPLKSWSSSPHEPPPMSKAVNAIVCLKSLLFQPQPQLLGGWGVGGAAGKGSSASGSHSLSIDHWPG